MIHMEYCANGEEDSTAAHQIKVLYQKEERSISLVGRASDF